MPARDHEIARSAVPVGRQVLYVRGIALWRRRWRSLPLLPAPIREDARLPGCPNCSVWSVLARLKVAQTGRNADRRAWRSSTGGMTDDLTNMDSPSWSRGLGMARKTVVSLRDDLDGGPADETVRFAIAGAQYEIDLSKKNAERFRQQVAPFLQKARRAGRSRRQPTRTAASRQRSQDIRAWAREQGIELSERGRIPASVTQQYEADVRTARRSGR
jgi:nucleoid-associated protein Lsr2